MRKAINLTGKRFGKWNVLKFYSNKKGHYYWECQCDCGSVIFVAQTSLISGRSKSCGCFHRNLMSQKMKGKTGENAPNWKNGRIKNSEGYIKIYKSDRSHCNVMKYISEHRLIVEEVIGRVLKSRECVHHIDNDKTNNCKKNLVACNDWGYHQILHGRAKMLNYSLKKMEVQNG